jgi:hypothetical protein
MFADSVVGVALAVDSHPHVTLLAQDLAPAVRFWPIIYGTGSANQDAPPHRLRHHLDTEWLRSVTTREYG